MLFRSFAANTAASMLTGGPKLLFGRGKNPLANSLVLGGATVGLPSAVNISSVGPIIPDVVNSFNYDKLIGSYSNPLGSLTSGVTDKLNSNDFMSDLKGYANDVFKGIYPSGFGDGATKLLGSAGLATLAQGAGLLGGGVSGMVGGGWLADKLMSLAVKRKWMKKRKDLQNFISDLASLAGAGVGAYAGLRGLNEVVRRYGSSKPAPVPAASPPSQ